jgi:predicted nucleic acid-binding Zn ribbon protein
MQRAGEILGLAVRRLEKPEAAMAWLEGAWTAVVGKELAAHTRPIRCTGGVLDIRASSKEWQNQIENMAGEFCNQINRAWGGVLVRGVRFSRARGPYVSKELDGEHTPFVRTQAERMKKPGRH